MENYINNIELINDYLNGKLSSENVSQFETRVNSDSKFNELYHEHRDFLRGIERIELKQQIASAKASYFTLKWVKIIASTVAIISIVAAGIYFMSTLNEDAPTPNEYESQKLVIKNDTIQSKSPTKANIIFPNSEKSRDSVILKESKPPNVELSKTESPISNLSIQKQPEVFVINPLKDTSITCKEGTVLKLKANSIVNPKTGAIVKEHYRLVVTEYYKLSDILLANLSTTSDGKPLETGGMLYVEAQQNGDKLELAESSSMDIEFPFERRKESMKLFSGQWEDEMINWREQSEEITQIVKIKEREENIEVPYALVEFPPIYPGCEGLSTTDEIKRCTSESIARFVNRNFNAAFVDQLNIRGRQRINVIFKINDQGNVTSIRSRAQHIQLSAEAEKVISNLPQMIPGKQRGMAVTVPYSLPIIVDVNNNSVSTGNIRGIIMNNTPVPVDSIFIFQRGKAELIREVLHNAEYKVDSILIEQWQEFERQKLIRYFGNEDDRKVILRKPLLELEGNIFKRLGGDSITRGGHIVRKLWDSIKVPTTTRLLNVVVRQQGILGNEYIELDELEDRIENDVNENISSDDVSKYFFSTSTLGWINVDRFISEWGRRIPYRLLVDEPSDINISMVFRDVYAILPSKRKGRVFDFKSVPENVKMTLIAIKKYNGKLFYDIVDSKTEPKPNIKFQFNEISVEELKNEIDKLNLAN